METQLPHHHRGWWREDSPIDRIDKRLSYYVFALELGLVLETLLLLPGTHFGIPISAFTLANALTYLAMDLEEEEVEEVVLHWLPAQMQAVFFQTHAHNFLLVFASMLAAWMVFFLYHLFDNNIVVVYLANKRYMLPAIALPVWLGGAFTQTAYRAATFYIVSWLVAQMVCTSLKVAFHRMRPSVAGESKHRISQVNRQFSSVQQLLCVGESAFESLPSGDTAGSAVFAAVLLLLGVPYAAALGMLTGFCRMYFHAHHLLDVSIGFAIGWSVPLLLHSLGYGLQYFDSAKTALVVVLALAFFIAIQRLKAEVPEHLRVEGRKGF